MSLVVFAAVIGASSALLMTWATRRAERKRARRYPLSAEQTDLYQQRARDFVE